MCENGLSIIHVSADCCNRLRLAMTDQRAVLAGLEALGGALSRPPRFPPGSAGPASTPS
jgi:hypothetical protein